MTSNYNWQGGIHVEHIVSENVVSGIQIKVGDAQSAAAFVRLAQAIQRGDISVEEIKICHLISGLQNIANSTKAKMEELDRKLLALRTKLELRLAAQEIPDTADAEDARESLTIAEDELAKLQPLGNRVLRKLDAFGYNVTCNGQTPTGKLGAMAIQLAPLAAIVRQVVQKLLGG